jgi:parallel beta-helix repeat protein
MRGHGVGHHSDISETLAALASSGAGATSSPAFVSAVAVFKVDNTGASDAGPAIQIAINTLAGTGQSLWFQAGTYLIKTALTVPSHTLMWGAPGVIFNQQLPAGSTATSTTFYAAPVFLSGPGSSTTLAGNNAPGALTISSTASVAVGQLIQLSNAATNLFVRYYRVTNVAGSGPFTLTLDRPVIDQWQAGDRILLTTSQPTDIRLYGNGMVITGTGDRYWEMFGGLRCVIDGVTVDSSLGSLSANVAVCMDLGSRDCLVSNLKVDVGSTARTGISLASSEDCLAINSRVKNATGSGFEIDDSDASYVIDCEAFNCQIGVTFSSNGGSIGCADCGAIGGSYNSNSNSGVLVASGSSRTVIQSISTKFNAVYGVRDDVTGGPTTGTTCTNVASIGNATGFLFVGPGWSINGCSVGGNSVEDVLTNVEGAIDGLTGIGCTGSAAGIFLNAGAYEARLSNVSLQSSTNGWIGVNMGTGGVRAYCTNVHVEMDGTASRAFVAAANAVACLTHVHATGTGVAGTIGWDGQSGSTVRIGPGVDFSTFGNNAWANIGGAHISRGQVTLNGATPVDVTWPDIVAPTSANLGGDSVALTLVTAVGTGVAPTVSITSKTKFTVTGAAGDTSTYAYAIE